jgi:hypothetical protein
MTPKTIAAMKPNDRSAARTFSRIASSIVASFLVALVGDSLRHGTDPHQRNEAMRLVVHLPSEKFFALREPDYFLVEYDQTLRSVGVRATDV